MCSKMFVTVCFTTSKAFGVLALYVKRTYLEGITISLVNSKWESLMKISSQCGFSVVEHPEGVIISAPYLPCIKEQV